VTGQQPAPVVVHRGVRRAAGKPFPVQLLPGGEVPLVHRSIRPPDEEDAATWMKDQTLHTTVPWDGKFVRLVPEKVQDSRRAASIDQAEKVPVRTQLAFREWSGLERTGDDWQRRLHAPRVQFLVPVDRDDEFVFCAKDRPIESEDAF